MKFYKNLYPQIYTWENLYAAWRKARKGKRSREPAAHLEYNLEGNLLRLCARRLLKTGQVFETTADEERVFLFGRRLVGRAWEKTCPV